MATRPLRLGQTLVEAGRLEEPHLRAALEEQQSSGSRFGDILIRRGYVNDTAVARSLAAQFKLPYVEGPLISEAKALGLVDAALARTRSILPLSATDRTLQLAVSDPLVSPLSMPPDPSGSGRRHYPWQVVRRSC